MREDEREFWNWLTEKKKPVKRFDSEFVRKSLRDSSWTGKTGRQMKYLGHL